MTLHAIIIGEKAKEPLHYADSVKAVHGKGLYGDRYFYGQGTFNKPQPSQDVREISILPYETLSECNRRLESSLDFLDLRRNLILKNFDASLLEDKVFTRELWEMATECPVVFPSGIGVVPWMVPGGREIAVATSELMKKYDLAIWAHHGMFAAGFDFDLTFGLMHTAEKSAEILVKTLSMQPTKRQTITPDEFRHLAKDFGVILPEEFLYEK